MNNLTNSENLLNSTPKKLDKARANIIKILQTRFKDVPEQLMQDINSLSDLSVLEKLFNNSIIVADFEDFQKNLEKAILRK